MDFNTFIIMIAWGLCGFISGVCGIGGAMFAVPLAAYFMPMQEVILISCILNFFMDFTISVMHLRWCRWKSLLPMFLGAFPGSVAGLYILEFLSETHLRLVVGILLICFAAWNLFAHVKARRECWPVASGAGFLAGVLGTSISFDGPPAGAYAIFAGWEPRVLLGTCGVFFVIREAFTCVLQYGAGLYSPEILEYALWGIPATICGTLLSFPVASHIRIGAMRKLVIAIVILGGFSCILKAY